MENEFKKEEKKESSIFNKKYNYQVDRETAERDFDRYAEMNDIDLDLEGLDENDKIDTQNQIQIIIKAIMRGQCRINEDGSATYTTKNGKELTFSDPGAPAWTAMDKKKEHRLFSKMCAGLAVMTKTSEATFTGMKSSLDIKFCQAIYTLFLA